MSAPDFSFIEKEVEDSLGNRLAKLAKRVPDQLAFKWQRKELSFKELNSRANEIAHVLLEQTYFAKTVAVLVSTSDRQAIAQLGVLKAGLICVPIDPSFPNVRKLRILKDSGAPLIVTDSDLGSLAEGLAGEGMCLINLDGARNKRNQSNPDIKVSPSDLAYVLYTSGSTGDPKGVMQNHRNLLHVAMLYHQDLGVGLRDRVTSPTALTYTGTIWAFLSTLMNGAAFICSAFDSPHQFASVLRRERITTVQLITTLLRQFMYGSEDFLNLPDLRKVYSGGEALHWADVELYAQRFPDHCRLLYNFGSTEAGIITHHPINLQECRERSCPLAEPSTALPVGYPVKDTDVIIKDDTGMVNSIGQEGEIVVESDYLALGYWGDTALTERYFEYDQGSTSGRPARFTSRDMGHLDASGSLVLTGRKDLQVKVRGYRINLEEIEIALRSLEGISGVAATVLTDAEDKNRIVALLQSDKGKSLSVDSIREALEERVPKYMVPANFILVDQLPVAKNGKLDRSVLPDLVARNQVAGSDYVEPITPQERFVCHLFQEILRVERVGMTDNFMNLGGDSLSAFRFLGKLRSLLDVNWNARVLFEEPTMKSLAQRLEEVPIDRFLNR